VADGTYGPRTWNKSASGTLPITIRKATQPDHGSNTGWSTAYGDGQAIFTGAHTVTTGYWVFDGVVGDYAAGVPYGFKFDFSEGDTAMKVNASGGTSFLFQYIDFDGRAATGNYNYVSNTKAFEVWSGSSWTVSHCSLHGGESLMQGGGNNYLVEFSYFYNSRSTANAWHANVFYNSGSNGGVFRYNRIWDYNAEGLFFTGYGGGVSNIKVYGNVFSGTGSEDNPRGIEMRQDYGYSGIEIYNNTFVRLGVGGILNRSPETGHQCTSCVARNNLSYSARNTLTGMTQDNNTDDSVNRFRDLSGGDFRLTGPLQGVSLGSSYSTDYDGSRRGADGVWDRGAFEFGGTSTSQTPTAPSGLRIVS